MSGFQPDPKITALMGQLIDVAKASGEGPTRAAVAMMLAAGVVMRLDGHSREIIACAFADASMWSVEAVDVFESMQGKA